VPDMAAYLPSPDDAECPECHSRNVLVLVAKAPKASLKCMVCGRLFAMEIRAKPENAPPDEKPCS